MANFGFVKCSRQERLKFFQSSLPYLNNNALILNTTGKAKKWSLEEPHATNKSFLTFKNGHYGIYFTLFNHELRKKEHDNPRSDSNKFIIILREPSATEIFPEFSISKAKQDIHNDINWLKKVSRNLLSTTSLVKLKCKFGQLNQTRGFSTTQIKSKDKNLGPAPHQKLDTQNIQKLSSEERYAETEKDCEIGEEDEEPFETSFLRTQLSQIVQAYENHTNSDDLNIIYPLYQSLKRNDILLPSIEEYNMVLKSVSMRSLDSEDSLLASEARLTCLLTVYRDILTACQTKSICQPNPETYRVVLQSIFKTSKGLLSLPSSDQEPRHSYQHRIGKVLEFCHVGVNLYTSLLQEAKVATYDIVPEILYCVNFLPNLLNKDLAASLVELKHLNLKDAQLYIGLISLAKFLISPQILGFDKRTSYEYISGIFDNYKSQCETTMLLTEAEYPVYSAMLKALIATGNYPIATKFLDNITLSFKKDLLSMKASQDSVADISALISDYLQELMDLGTQEHLDKAYDLLKIMRQVTYLPDVSTPVYNDMIGKYIFQYIEQEQSKRSTKNFNEGNRAQEATYKKIWELYNYVAIRKDFTRVVTAKKSLVSSTEMLLSLTLDLGDLPNISRLLKEILLRNVFIMDWTVLKKLCYFLTKQAQNGDSYHHQVMCEILEKQATYLGGDSAQLNDFLSEHVSYILSQEQNAFEYFLNLNLIREAFEKFDLQTNNAHGLVTVMNYLQSMLDSRRLTDLEISKVLLYQAYMINEFENTENHYLELPSELMAFQTSLKNSFKLLALKVEGKQFLSDPVRLAGSSLGLDFSVGHALEQLSHSHYKRNLMPYFNASGREGTKLFIKLFKEGYNFTDETWSTIINRSFSLDILEPGKIITTSSFVERLVSAANQSLCIAHILSLLSLENDKVNIEVFKFLVSQKHDKILTSTNILNKFTCFSRRTKNQYFLSLFSKEFMRIAGMNPHKGWMVNFFDKLNMMGRYTEVHSIVSKNFDFFNKGLDIRLKHDELFLKHVLVAYMEAGKEEEINEIFNYHFLSPEQKKLLLGSNDLLTCLLDYYVSVGSYDMVTKKFGKLADRSADLKQSIQFTNFLSSLKGLPESSQFSPEENAESLALTLLQENNLLEMRNIYEKNKHLVHNEEKFFNILINDLTKAAKLLDGEYMGNISAKFEAVIKFCKVIQLSKVSAQTLSNLVGFLTITNSRNLLNILFNKFLVDNTLVPSFNFYFLEVELQSEAELVSTLEKFEAGFKKIDDLLNLQMVEDFKTTN